MISNTKKLIIVLIALIILAVSGMSAIISKTGSAFIIALAFVVLGGTIPFLIGVIIQAVLWRHKLPFYVAWIVTLLIVSIYWFTRGKVPIHVLENTLLSFLASVLIIGIFINAGIKSFNSFREGLRKA